MSFRNDAEFLDYFADLSKEDAEEIIKKGPQISQPTNLTYQCTMVRNSSFSTAWLRLFANGVDSDDEGFICPSDSILRQITFTSRQTRGEPIVQVYINGNAVEKSQFSDDQKISKHEIRVREGDIISLRIENENGSQNDAVCSLYFN